MAVASTPTVADNHPALKLSPFVSEDIKQQLLKTPPFLLIEDPIYQNRLKELRNNFKYCFVVQWLYLLRSLIRLTNEAFDVITFEEELLGIASPVFINKFQINLIHVLTNYKIINISSDLGISDFNERVAHLLNLTDSETDLDFNFYSLDLLGQIDIYYQLINLIDINHSSNFRKTIDKFTKPNELKISPAIEIISNDRQFKEEYFILEDGRLYYKKLEFTKWKLPKKRVDFVKENIDNKLLNSLTLEPVLSEWKCLTAGIYEFDDYLKELKANFGKKSASNEYKLLQVLKDSYEKIFPQDLKKRKQLLQRKREIQMQNLMANRKRSSRLEEKERQKQEDEQRQLEELERLKREGTELRAAKRMKLKGESSRESSVDSRADRLNKRNGSPDTTTQSSGEDSWNFDCLCGLKGENIDDGKTMINCEKCNRWQHLHCQPAEVQDKLNNDKEYTFVCSYDRQESDRETSLVPQSETVDLDSEETAKSEVAEPIEVEPVTETQIEEHPVEVVETVVTMSVPVAEQPVVVQTETKPLTDVSPVVEPIQPTVSSVVEPAQPISSEDIEPSQPTAFEAVESVQPPVSVVGESAQSSE